MPDLGAYRALRLDEVAWVRYKGKLQQKNAREHIVSVQHAKAQNSIGKTSLVIFLLSSLFYLYLTLLLRPISSYQ